MIERANREEEVRDAVMQQPPRHTWTFFRVGGFAQVRLDSGADLAALGELDQKLWTALACPTKGLEFDARTLALIDSDNDGRIRAPDIISYTHLLLLSFCCVL